MSDVGFLSYEYTQASRLAEKLEGALAEAELSPRQTISRQSRQQLSLALRSLVDLLEPERAEAPDPEDTLALPVTLVRHLRQRKHSGRSYAVALAELAERLADRDAELGEEDLRLLHELTGAAETEASRARRRMIRR